MWRTRCARQFRLRLSPTVPTLCATGALAHSVRLSSAKLARVFTMELNRARSEFRRSPTQAQKEECLRALSETPLQRLQGLDGKTVALCLSTLATLDAPADLPLIHDCAIWVSVHPNAFSPHSLAQALHSLTLLDYADLATVVRAVQGVLPEMAAEMQPSSLCQSLSAALRADAIEVASQLAELVTGALRDGLGITETAMIAAALGHRAVCKTGRDHSTHAAHSLTPPSSCASLERLAAAVWSRVPEDELGVVPLADLVGLLSAVCAAPAAQRTRVEPRLLAELAGRLRSEPLVSARSAVLVAEALPHLRGDPRAAALTALEAFAQSDALTLPAAAQLLSAYAHVGAAPEPLVRFLVRAIHEGREKWSAMAVHAVLRGFAADATRRPDAMALAARRVDRLSARVAAKAPVEAADVAALLVEGVVEPHAEPIAAAVAASIGRWSVPHVLTFLAAAAAVPGRPTRAVMRDVASRLAPFMERATAAQLASVAAAYGRARVRNDAFCAAVAARAAVLAAELTLHQAGTILGGLAAVEYRDTKLFVDLAPLVLRHAQGATTVEVSTLLAAYSKMLIWNFKVIWSLAERATVIYADFTLPQLIAVLVALNRMDVQHPDLATHLLEEVIRRDATAPVARTEAVMLLSAFSRCGAWDAAFFDRLAERIVAAEQELSSDELAETLMSFARVGLSNYNIFDALTLRALAVAPTSSPMCLAHFAVAYATVGCRHEELFAIIADRFISQKSEVPAVTIAAVLNAFATVGIRNDRLFIEAIPRVRHVGQYGTPKDITNVVHAYAQVGLWHYKLFVRLADRATQLRGEFRCHHLTRLLKSYAMVDMRYEKLFVEFSARVQTVAHLLTPGEVAEIVTAYAKVRIPDTAVFQACGDRALELIDAFELNEAKATLVAFKKAKVDHMGLAAALGSKFPEALAALQELDNDEDGEVEKGTGREDTRVEPKPTSGLEIREEAS